MPKRFLYVDLETGELDPAVRHRRVDVVNAAARLALTAATVNNGDHVREVGQQEIVQMTCVGNIYGSVPAVAEVLQIVIVEITVAVAAGTVYKVLAVAIVPLPAAAPRRL